MWGIHAGRRVRGAFSFGSLLWACKERNPSYGGGTPLENNRRSGDPKEEKLTSLAGDQNANAESLELRFGKRVLEAIIGAVEDGLPEHFHGIGRSSL